MIPTTRKATKRKVAKRKTKRKARKARTTRKTKPVESAKTPSVSTITPDELTATLGGGSAEPGPSGRDAFREEATQGEGSGFSSSGAPPSPFDEGVAVIGLLETALTVLVAAQASALKVRDYPKEWARFTPEERSQLAMVAPMAAPFLRLAIERAPMVGAGFAAVMFAIFAGRRSKDLRALARERAASRPEDQSQPKAAEDTQRNEAGEEPVRGDWPEGVPGPSTLRRVGFPEAFEGGELRAQGVA